MLVGQWSNVDNSGCGGLPQKIFWGYMLHNIGRCTYLKQNIACFQELQMQKLHRPLLFLSNIFTPAPRKNNLIPLCKQGSIIKPDISGVGYMKCIEALPQCCNNFKRGNVAVVHNNGNKSMLFLRSDNYCLCIASAKGCE